MAKLGKDIKHHSDGPRREALKDLLHVKFKKNAAETACRACDLKQRGLCRKGSSALLSSLLYSDDKQKNASNMRSVLKDETIDTSRTPCEVIFCGKKAVKNYMESAIDSPIGWLNQWEINNDK